VHARWNISNATALRPTADWEALQIARAFDALLNRVPDLFVDFVDYRTTNAERIKLFCNARESDQYYCSYS